MRTSAKSGLFLIEMIIAIMFFAICSAICTSLFVRAHLISEQTSEINMAVVTAQSVAECFKAADGSEEETIRLIDADFDGVDINLYYDSNWTRIEDADGAYRVRVRIDGENSAMRHITVSVMNTRIGSEIYTLEAQKYVP